MRALAIFAALALVTAPVLVAPSAAYADGIERSRQRPPARQSAPPTPAPRAIIEQGPETVTLPESFFVGGGGVGADIGMETLYPAGNTVIRVRIDPRHRGRRRPF
jgi:hypothetical protein